MFVKSPMFLSAVAVLAGAALPAAAEIDLVRPEDEELVSGVYAESVPEPVVPYAQRQTFGEPTVERPAYRQVQPVRQDFVFTVAEEDDFFVPVAEQDEEPLVSVSDDGAFSELSEEAKLVEVDDECPMWGESGGCYGYGRDVKGNDSYYRFWQYMAQLGIDGADVYGDDNGDWRSLGFARRAALLPLSDRFAFYRAGVDACLGMYKDDIEAQKATIYDGNVYDNTAQLSHIFASVNKCYEEVGYGIINDYYNADLRTAQDFSAKVNEFYVQGAGLNFNPKFCDEACTLTDLVDAQTEQFEEFRVYLLRLITKRPRSGYGYGF